ncbi:MAG: sodium/sulfate symporter, partial [Zetaproteobacteria bacterium]
MKEGAESAHPFANPGRTKLALTSFGVRLAHPLRTPSRWISMANAVETVIDLRLPSGHWCTVPVGMPFCAQSPIALRIDEEDACGELVWGEARLPVRLVPAPRFAARRTRSGARMGSFAALHDRLLVLHPFLGCGFFARERRLACQFCAYDSPLNAAEPPLRPALDLVEALHAALAEREVDTVLLYAGFSPEPDRGLGRLAPIVALLRRHLG